MLKDYFLQLLQGYTTDTQHANQLWAEIEEHYSEKKRSYHTLTHIEQLLQQLLNCKEQIADWDTVLFSLFYHDIIYNPLRQDNEEQSAELAVKRLNQLSYPLHKSAICYAQILATKGHQLNKDSDTNLFTDADLSILGSNETTYSQYATDIRKEYAAYPDIIYKKGRAKVLQHFLQMQRIYKTAYFYERFEKQARLNVTAELKQLQ
jgi:predicted metal-dependent HD superfamily phosphohydrolase